MHCIFHARYQVTLSLWWMGTFLKCWKALKYYIQGFRKLRISQKIHKMHVPCQVGKKWILILVLKNYTKNQLQKSMKTNKNFLLECVSAFFSYVFYNTCLVDDKEQQKWDYFTPETYPKVLSNYLEIYSWSAYSKLFLPYSKIIPIYRSFKYAPLPVCEIQFFFSLYMIVSLMIWIVSW